MIYVILTSFLTSLHGLEEVPNIENLGSLSIRNNSISSFDGMPVQPNLQELDISGNQFSEDAKEQGRELMPNIVITTDTTF